MILKGKKVSLKSIQKEDIELIRQWRNSKDINQFYIFRGYISKEQQRQWFEKVTTSGRDYYFLVIVDDKPIGLSQIKNIDWDRREGETGMFIAKDEYKNSLISFEASYLLGRHFFHKLNLLKNKVQVLESNKTALRYIRSQGFKEVGIKEVEIDDEICNVVLFELTRNDYEKRAKKRERLLRVIA